MKTLSDPTALPVSHKHIHRLSTPQRRIPTWSFPWTCLSDSGPPSPPPIPGPSPALSSRPWLPLDHGEGLQLFSLQQSKKKQKKTSNNNNSKLVIATCHNTVICVIAWELRCTHTVLDSTFSEVGLRMKKKTAHRFFWKLPCIAPHKNDLWGQIIHSTLTSCQWNLQTSSSVLYCHVPSRWLAVEFSARRH